MKNLFLIFLLLSIELQFSFSQSKDNIIPASPILNYVTVDLSSFGTAELHWTPSSSTDVVKYYIYMDSIETSNNWIIQDTIFGLLADTYINLGSFASMHPESYAIASVDSSGNISSITPHHTTIYAFPYLIGDSVIHLVWSNYIGWDTVHNYKIYVKTNSSPFEILGIVSGDSTVYDHINFVQNQQYCYYVDAIHYDGRVSHSNMTCIVPHSSIIEQQYDFDKYFNCYPNPTKSKILIESKYECQGETIEIIDLNGQVLLRIKGQNKITTLNIEQLPKGYYTIKILTEKGILTRKIIRE